MCLKSQCYPEAGPAEPVASKVVLPKNLFLERRKPAAISASRLPSAPCFLASCSLLQNADSFQVFSCRSPSMAFICRSTSRRKAKGLSCPLKGAQLVLLLLAHGAAPHY